MDIENLLRDINLILSEKEIKVMSPRSVHDEKYLKKDENGIWHIVFRVPARFGGKLIRQSLFTKDFAVASSIRDRFVVPVLALNSGIHALEEIGRSIIAAEGEAVDHLSSLTSIIQASDGITLTAAGDRYIEYMNTSAKYRPNTIIKYTEYVRLVSQILGGGKQVAHLTKQDAVHLRDTLIKQGKSPTTVFHVFSIIRSFLRWLNREGIISSRFVIENFTIDLPQVHKVNTPIIPPSKADDAMRALPQWMLVPRILRYTGMRVGEVEACIAGFQNCGIVEVEGYRCFKISKEFCKTYADRYVPICDKLAPYMTEKAIEDAARRCKIADNGRRRESNGQKKYNRAVKRVPGCETCKVHSWRVYAQTMMLEAGIDESIVKRIIGHKDKGNVHYGYTAARIEAMKKALDLIP